jgi:DNA-binding XRE family transcriptional regulator
MKPKNTVTFKSADDFGRAFGLSDLDIELIRQKRRLIAKLKKVREDLGMTQAHLAKLVGTKQPAIARMEAGDIGSVSLDFIGKIAMVLGITVTIRPAKHDAA